MLFFKKLRISENEIPDFPGLFSLSKMNKIPWSYGLNMSLLAAETIYLVKVQISVGHLRYLDLVLEKQYFDTFENFTKQRKRNSISEDALTRLKIPWLFPDSPGFPGAYERWLNKL